MVDLMLVSDAIGKLAGFNLFLIFVVSPGFSWAVGKGFWNAVGENLFGSFFEMLGFTFSVVGLVGSLMIHYGVISFA